MCTKYRYNDVFATGFVLAAEVEPVSAPFLDTSVFIDLPHAKKSIYTNYGMTMEYAVVETVVRTRGNSSLADAILTRLVHNAYKLAGRRYRLRIGKC